MRAIGRFCAVVAALMVTLAQAQAQDVIPTHRYLFTQNVDFYGSDLAAQFDTTQDACARACSAQASCVAFTFNRRNGSCFPKTDVSDQVEYQGAISARKVLSGEAAQGLAAAQAAKLAILTDADLKRARALVGENAKRYSFGLETLDDILAALAVADQAGNLSSAMGWAGKAVALSDRPSLWAEYARLSLRRGQDQNNSDKRRSNRAALSAAINAYLRADQTAVEVNALDILAKALEANRRGRDMIPALRLAAATSGRDDLGEKLDRAIGLYGFRVVDHRVDNNAAAPRICAEFSHDLVQVGVDYDPFVRVEGRGLVTEVSDRQLCLDGVEHGKRYDVTLRAGLPAADGESLHRDVRLKLYVRDRAPLVRFPGRAYVLPRALNVGLPVETVNTDVLDLKLRRVSDRNLVRAIRESYFGKPLNKYEDDQFSQTLAQEVWSGQGTVENTLNVDMTTRLPLGEVLMDQEPGIFTLSASVPGQDPYDNPSATQWFVVSDLGLSTWSGTDGLSVAVRGLSDTEPRANVTLTLVSRANAVLGEVTTDAAGIAQFSAGLTRGTGAARPALLMAEDGGDDIAFLPLTDPAFDLSDRGVEGRPPAPPIDTFLSTDRGAYRVGETIYATALTRDETGKALGDLPVTAILKRPDGVEYSRHLSQNEVAGGHVFALPLGRDVPRGAWRVDILSDLNHPPLASQTVLVEDFLPERLDFDLTLPEAPLRLGQTPPLRVDARYLFGAPGANLRVEGTVRLSAKRQLDGWEGYYFGRHDVPFRRQTAYLDGVITDAAGQAQMPLTLPKLEEDPRLPLEAEVVLQVAEGSGRPVERRLTKAVMPSGHVIGIKPLFEGELPEAAEARFEVIALSPEGTPVEMPVKWTVNRVETRYQWYQLYGNWEWEPTVRRTRVASGELTLGSQPVSLGAATDWGAYELVVERIGGDYFAGSVDFYAGWYGGGGDVDTPDRLTVVLDAERYAPGDRAQLRFVAEDAGTAVVSVMSNRIIHREVLRVAAGEVTVPLAVTEDWGSGAYVSVSHLREMDAEAGVSPARALGIVHAAVVPGQKALKVSVKAPEVVDGGAGVMTATVQVDGVAQGDQAYVTLAAVDLGILNLTGFRAPDVTGHYFGQRRLGVEMRDIYGRLIDGFNGALGSIRSGGDAAASVDVQSPPPTEKLMAFFSGPIAVGPDGQAEIKITRPAFNGTVKLMVVAWSKGGVGQAQAEVIARDPVVMTASLPRILAPGDESRLLLELVHADGPAGEVALTVQAEDGLTLGDVPGTVILSAGGTARLSIPVIARAVGDPLITVTLTSPDGQEHRRILRMPVRRNDPEVTQTRRFTLDAGAAFTFDANVFAGFAKGSASATLSAGPLAQFDVPGLLHQLDRYPYGCTEQLTSGAMPLLYLSSVAETAGLGGLADSRKKVDGAIERILSRQSSNGAFGMWSAGSGEFWLDAYVTDFLSRARRQGHVVPDVAFRLAMDNLRNRVSYASDFENGGGDLAYALLVLAREGAAQMGDLRYYADTKREDFATALGAAQLGAALAAYGDPLRADAMFRRAGVLMLQQQNWKGWRSDFGTPFRDAAAVLKLTAEAGSQALNPSDLLAQVSAPQRSLSTQEAAQIVLAAHALSAPEAGAGLQVDGAPVTGPLVTRLNDRQSTASVIKNVSDTPTDVTLTTFGVPEVAPDAGGYGYAISRRYFTMNGVEVSGVATQGARLVVVLEVTPFEKIGARLIVNDPLPGGFEIDNPNLLRSGSVKGLEWLETTAAENAEFRSDRFVAAVNYRGTSMFRLAYVVRAVTPGVYHHPAAMVEDMYRAEYRANTQTGQMIVK